LDFGFEAGDGDGTEKGEKGMKGEKGEKVRRWECEKVRSEKGEGRREKGQVMSDE